jgi:6-pyruvoyltetrahydropterin/6-carboxytetrahydropterin synthase
MTALVDVYKEFVFEAAHFLPAVPPDHKCRRLHGHSFRVEVHVRGALGAASGWVVDFADLKRAFAPLYEQLDHNYLNDVEGLSNPTSENIACWIWDRLKPSLPGLCQVVIRETCTAGCVYRGEKG